MKKKLILTLFFVLNILLFEPLISKEIIEDKNLIEKVSFNIWWEDKYNDSVITFRKKIKYPSKTVAITSF